MPNLYTQTRWVHCTIDAMMPNFTFSKVLTEGAVGTDTVLKATQRTLSEGAIGTDTVSAVIVHIKTFTEGIIGTDSVIRSIVKVLTEGAIGTDSVLRMGVKVLSEGMIGTDRVLRSAVKVLTEGIIGTDTIRKLINGSDVIWTHISKAAAAVYTKVTKATTSWTHVDKN